MDEEVKSEIQAVLTFLKTTLVRNSVSIAVSAENGGVLYFFDTEKYLESKKMDGFNVSIGELVR